MTKKISLVQLPYPVMISEKAIFYSSSQVPLAIAYLKANAMRYEWYSRVEIYVNEDLNINIGGDSFLIDMLSEKSPDIIGFSLYPWNLVRSLYIAAKIKDILPEVKIIVGGPEVALDNDLIKNCSAVDVMVLGEGEETFSEILESFVNGSKRFNNIKGICYREDGKFIPTSPREYKKDRLNKLPSPYLTGILSPKIYPRFHFITVRGCPFKCAYCSWQNSKIAMIPFEVIREELELAVRKKVKYIIFYDSCFNLFTRFKDICKLIINLNRNSTFICVVQLQAEFINEETVDLLADCNISQVVVGLQSTNPGSLEVINREFDLKKWVRGINLLKKRNISISLSFILGLPGETLKTLKETIDFVKNLGVEDEYMEPFILGIFHNTPIRKNVSKYGIEFQSEPPYQILRTDTLSFEDIKTTLNLANRTFGILKKDSIVYPNLPPDSFPLMTFYYRSKILPALPITKIILSFDSYPSLFKGGDLGGEEAIIVEKLSKKIAKTLVIWFKCKNIEQELDLIISFLNFISRPNPYNVWNILIETSRQFPLKIIDEIKNAIFYKPNFLDYQSLYYRENPDLPYYRISTKIYTIFSGKLESGRIENWIEEMDKESPVFLSYEINPRNCSIDRLCKILKFPGRGVLFNGPSEISQENNLRVLRLIKEANVKDKVIRFKRLEMQKLWDFEFKEGRTPSYKESVIYIR